MSRDNIVSMGFVSRSEFRVTFNARDGERSYAYSAASGIAIMGGADPHDYAGVEVGALDSLENLAEDIGELAEV